MMFLFLFFYRNWLINSHVKSILCLKNAEAAECAEILAQYGVEPHEYEPVINALRRNPQAWLDFMMK